MAGPHWHLDEDRKIVTVTFPTAPPIALHLDAAEVENLLKQLGNFRRLMEPAIAADYAIGRRSEAVANPRWMTEPDVMRGESLLHVRDPRYGWLHYLLPPSEAGKLGEALKSQAAAPPHGPPQGGKLN